MVAVASWYAVQGPLAIIRTQLWGRCLRAPQHRLSLCVRCFDTRDRFALMGLLPGTWASLTVVRDDLA